LGRAMELQAQFWYKEGKFEEARSEALRAVDVYEKIGAAKDVEDCKIILRKIETSGEHLERRCSLRLLTLLSQPPCPDGDPISDCRIQSHSSRSPLSTPSSRVLNPQGLSPSYPSTCCNHALFYVLLSRCRSTSHVVYPTVVRLVIAFYMRRRPSLILECPVYRCGRTHSWW
jgi:hypothetical protein